MPTNRQTCAIPTSLHWCAGFSLVEMLLVISLVGGFSALVMLAMPDSRHTKLHKLASEITAVLEKGRAQSRSQNTALWWQATPNGYTISRTKNSDAQASAHLSVTPWSDPDMQSDDTAILLGPEPILQPSSLRIWMRDEPTYRITIKTDGLQPFAIDESTAQ